MASPMKPVPAATPAKPDDAELEFGAAVTRVQRRDIDAAQKGFDEHRQHPEEQGQEPSVLGTPGSETGN